MADLSPNVLTFTLKLETDIFRNMLFTRNIKYNNIDSLKVKKWKDRSIPPARGAGGAAASGAPGGPRGAGGASRPELEGRRKAPGAGSAPARAPLAGACLSRRLAAQVNSIGGRRRALPGWTGGGRGRRRHRRPSLRTSLRDCAKRASSRRSQLSERDFLGAPSPSRRCRRPSSVPPRAPRPSPPLLSAPAPGRPRGGAVPGRDFDSCRSPRGSGPSSPRPPSRRAGASGTATLRTLPAAVASSAAPRQGKASRPAGWG